MSSHRILLAALATTALASPAVAQSWRPAPPPAGAPPIDAGRPAFVDDPVMIEPMALRRPPPPPVRANDELVIDGDFESPRLAPGTWNVFDAIAGWQTSRGPGIEIQHGVAGAPFAGNQHVELDSHASSAMFQMLPTAPGATYLVTYRVSPRPGVAADDNQLEVRWDGAVIDRYVADRVVGETEWELRAMLVTARGTSTRLELADTSVSDGLGAYIDDVSVKLVGRAPALAPTHRPAHWPPHDRGFARRP